MARIQILGAEKSGKTSLLHGVALDSYMPDIPKSVGSDSVEVFSEGNRMQASASKWIVCCDVTNPNSMNFVNNITKGLSFSEKPENFILVATKTDVSPEQRVLSSDMLKSFAEEKGMHYIETSLNSTPSHALQEVVGELNTPIKKAAREPESKIVLGPASTVQKYKTKLQHAKVPEALVDDIMEIERIANKVDEASSSKKIPIIKHFSNKQPLAKEIRGYAEQIANGVSKEDLAARIQSSMVAHKKDVYAMGALKAVMKVVDNLPDPEVTHKAGPR